MYTQIMASRPNDVSAEVWLLALALSRLLPATVYVGMMWRVLHMMKNGTRQSDQAVAVIAALCVKNAATIEKFMTLLDGLDTHPSIGEFCQVLPTLATTSALSVHIRMGLLPTHALVSIANFWQPKDRFWCCQSTLLAKPYFPGCVVGRCMCVSSV